MYYENETRALIKLITIVACICLIVSGVVYVVSDTLVDMREKREYESFLKFLDSVNAGEYDNKMSGYPEEIRIRSFEKCFDKSTYLWGKIGAYTFQGYTSSSSPMGAMTWRFTGYPNFCIEAFLNAISLSGLVVSMMMFMPGAGYLFMKGLRKFING